MKAMRSRKYLQTLMGLVLFLVLYAYFSQNGYRHIIIYFLVLFTLYNSFTFPTAAVVCSGVGFGMLFLPPLPPSWTITTGIASLLLAAIILPLYFDWSRRWEHEKFQQRHEPQVQKFYTLQSAANALKEERKANEAEIEKINQLYVLGRELVEHMEMADVVDHLQRILLARPGIKSVSIFSWEKSNWKPLSFSRPELEPRWLEFVADQQFLSRQSQCGLLLAPQWLESQSLIYWPVRLEKELLAGIFLTADMEAAPRYLDEGAVFIPQIALGLKRTKLFAEVQERSRSDSLTGLYRRSYFLERLQTEIKRAERYKAVFSLLMMDIDHFKKVNDTYGHVVGDEVLRTLSHLFTGSVREGDMLGRYGGEEFVIFLYLASPAETTEIARKINRITAEHVFSTEAAQFSVTVSIGTSSYPADGTTAEELLSAADQALYWVKSHGRNGIKEYRELEKGQAEGGRKKKKHGEKQE